MLPLSSCVIRCFLRFPVYSCASCVFLCFPLSSCVFLCFLCLPMLPVLPVSSCASFVWMCPPVLPPFSCASGVPLCFLSLPVASCASCASCTFLCLPVSCCALFVFLCLPVLPLCYLINGRRVLVWGVKMYNVQTVGVHRWRPYRVECTGSLPTSEVKRRRARLVLGWGTAREDLRVLPAFGRKSMGGAFWFGFTQYIFCKLYSPGFTM